MPETETLLAIYDISGIQEYIFATSRLRENAGASYIVDEALKSQLPAALKELGENRVVTGWDQAASFRMLEHEDLLAEIVYIGGGSAVVAYRGLDFYNRVNEELALALLAKSYTLTLITTYIKTRFENYHEDRKALEKKLEMAKYGSQRQRPLGALPLVAQEGLTGLPVTQADKNWSALQTLKDQAYEKEVKQERKLPEGLQFAVEVENLITEKGKDAMVAVVHIDGNSMGELIKNAIADTADYQAAVRKMRQLSGDITKIYQQVFDDTVDSLCRWWHEHKPMGGDKEREHVPQGNKNTLPLRPILIGGDDVTFICNNRLALPFTAAFLRRLAGYGDRYALTACAGIALVHSHFPFNIAYEIAESCCRNAKEVRREKRDEGPDGSYLDFHLVRDAYIKDMKDWRKMISQKHKKALPRAEDGHSEGGRPYRVALRSDAEDSRSFDCLDGIVARIAAVTAQERKGFGKWSRWRLKRLYEAHLLEPEQSSALWAEFASRGCTVESLLRKEPHTEEMEVIYDAIEIMDIYATGLFSQLTNASGKEGSE